MFGFIEKVLFTELTTLSSVNPLNTTPFKCISMTNQKRNVRPEIVNINSNEPEFYHFSIITSMCSGSCNNIIDSYAKMSVPNVIKNRSFKVFNIMSKNNETSHIE